jgi:hypothetical protein
LVSGWRGRSLRGDLVARESVYVSVTVTALQRRDLTGGGKFSFVALLLIFNPTKNETALVSYQLVPALQSS